MKLVFYISQCPLTNKDNYHTAAPWRCAKCKKGIIWLLDDSHEFICPVNEPEPVTEKAETPKKPEFQPELISDDEHQVLQGKEPKA